MTTDRVPGGSEGKIGCFAYRRGGGVFKETKVTSLRTNARQHLITKGHAVPPAIPTAGYPAKAGLTLLSHLLQGQGL